MRFFRPKLCAVLVLGALALSLAGCGRRGPLGAPPGAAATNAPLTGAPDAVPTPRSGEAPALGAAALAVSPSTGVTEPANPLPRGLPRSQGHFFSTPCSDAFPGQ
ncbi:lipoprotein [Methylocapsa polymorpha]|uniref:Lipoprotein n=1 Tax=Methylocapsa polymorpha TaxID=3080828 RepID=A0ABZ0HW72_9HYPH|nr:lipoprotein [Methylocapsa sp. RX1]